jgi:hypothetical protein
MMRQRLPHRRPSLTLTIEDDGQRYHLTVGFDPVTAEPSEMFLHGPRTGTQMASLVHDGSILASLAMQHGIPASALVKSLSQCTGPNHHNMPASPIGAALALVASMEGSPS